MSQKPHKIEVFPTTYENDEIDFAKIENYLKDLGVADAYYYTPHTTFHMRTIWKTISYRNNHVMFCHKEHKVHKDLHVLHVLHG